MKQDDFFKKLVDELVEFGKYDKELADGMKWLDGIAQKEGVSFYDKVYEVLYKHDSTNRAKKWLQDKMKEHE